MRISTVLFAVTTLAAIVLFAAVFARGAGPDWIWRGGRKDPFRAIFFREDGSWRSYGRLGFVAIVGAFLLLGYFAL
jgi:hypothetical protein